MYYLNKMVSNRIYQRKLYSMNDSDKNHKFNQLIIHIGNNSNSIINYLNDPLFKPELFNNFYSDKIIISLNKRKKKIINQSLFYKDLKSKVNKVLHCYNTLKGFKNRNLIIDLTQHLLLNDSSNTLSKLLKMENYFKYLSIQIDKYKGYSNKVILVNLESTDENEMLLFTDYFINSLNRKKNLLDYLNGHTVLFYSLSKHQFLKIEIDNELYQNKALILNKLNVLISNSVDENEIEDEQEAQVEITPTKDNVKSSLINHIKSNLNISKGFENDETLSDVEDIIDSTVENPDNEGKTEEEILELLDQDNDFKEKVDSLKNQKTSGKSKLDPAVLKSKQDEVVFDNVKLSDIFNEFNAIKIDNEEISQNVLNDEIKISNTKDFDITYMNKQFSKDVVSVLKAFNEDPDIKLYVTKANLVENNTDLDKVKTLELEFQDEYKTKHSIKVDIPEISEGRYMYLNGSKKILMKQIMLKPIVKTANDTVEISTNYNKLFVKRFGQKRSLKLNYLRKLFTSVNLKKYLKQGNSFNYKNGNSLKINEKYLTNIEYNDISSYIINLEINNMKLEFNQEILVKMLDPKSNTYKPVLGSINYDKKNYFPIGYTTKNELILSNISTRELFIAYMSEGQIKLDNLSKNLSTFIIDTLNMILDPKYKELVSDTIKSSNSLTYSRVEINNKSIPIIILLGYELGLLNVLERYGIKYEFTETNKRISVTDDLNKIKFEDGYLIYDSSLMRNDILLSGLSVLDTENIAFNDLNTQEPYIDWFYDKFNSRNVGKGIHNTLTLLIDPITKEILHDLKQPENVYDVLLYANTLLEDLSFYNYNDMHIYRLRGSEQVPAMLYKILADNYRTYKDTYNARNPKKMSVPQNILTKSLLELKTVDEYSELNPSLEIEKMGAATYKGLSGKNSDDAYTNNIRSYDKSMSGVFAINSPDSDKIGVVRQLTYNSKITSTRGYLDVDSLNNSNSNLYSYSELLNPFTTTHADPPRIGIFICAAYKKLYC